MIPSENLKALPSVDVREHVSNANYTGPTQKGVRFSWEKLPEFIGILEKQAEQLSETTKSQPTLFPEGIPQG